MVGGNTNLLLALGAFAMSKALPTPAISVIAGVSDTVAFLLALEIPTANKSASICCAIACIAGAITCSEKSLIFNVISFEPTLTVISLNLSIVTGTEPSAMSCASVCPVKFLATKVAGFLTVIVSPTLTKSAE